MATPPSPGAPNVNGPKRPAGPAAAVAHFNLKPYPSGRPTPGCYHMSIGTPKAPGRVEITIQQNPRTGNLESLFLNNARFSLSYRRRSPFGVSDVIVHTGAEKEVLGQPYFHLWEDIGIRGRFLLRRVGLQKQAYIGGHWVSAAVLADGNVVHAGRTYVYNKRQADFEAAPPASAHPVSRPAPRERAAGSAAVGQPFLQADFLTSSLTYGGVVGRMPASMPTHAKPSVRVFLATAGRAILYSPRIGRTLVEKIGGPVRWLGKSKGLLLFNAAGLEIFRQASAGTLEGHWLLRLPSDEVFPMNRSWCALGLGGRLAALIVTQRTWVLNVVNTTNGACLALPLNQRPTGVAFRGHQILVSVRRNQPRVAECLVVAPSGAAPGRLAVVRRFVVPGRLVGVVGNSPVFESRSKGEVFTHGHHLRMGVKKIRRVLCGHGKVIVVTNSGAVWLWGRGKARRLLRARTSAIGAGQRQGGFWLVESSGRADLISPTGQVQFAQLKLPVPR